MASSFCFKPRNLVLTKNHIPWKINISINLIFKEIN